jgi:uncharacterized protein
MNGEKDLGTLLRTLEPVLHQGEYAFCCVDRLEERYLPFAVAFVREAEGYTLVLPRPEADRLGLIYTFAGAWITLTVHSDLAAVGLTAAFSTALAEAGISCNVVAGYFHDHIFVDGPRAQQALEVLRQLSGGQQKTGHK